MFGWILLALIFLIFLVCIVRVLRVRPVSTTAQKEVAGYVLDADAIAKRVAGALRFKTVSTMDEKDTDWAEFEGLQNYMETTYPLVHRTLTRERISNYSLLYCWKGTGSNKLPILLMAHQDVVPVSADTADQWKHDAFSGDIEGGYVWGRGALDMKGQLMSILESAEHLIAAGFVPQRDIYFAFGHNEEIVNETGAKETSKTLFERGIRFEYVLDEGGAIVSGKSFSVSKTLALIGVCEKGYIDVLLTSKANGGHAAMPPKHTALGIVAQAIVNVEKKPMKAAIAGPTAQLFDALLPNMGLLFKILFANRWLFGGLLKSVLTGAAQGNALIRTTNAATMAQASVAPNVLPQVVTAIINYRIAPWDTSKKVLEHTRKAIKDNRVEVSPYKVNEPSKVSAIDNSAYGIVSNTVAHVYPDMIVAPYPMVAATDSRFYQIVSDNIYRFVPFRSMLEDLGTVHANNERVSVESLREAVVFFMQLIENSK